MTPRALLLPLARLLARQDPAPARAPCPVIRVLPARAGAPATQALAAVALHLMAAGGKPHVWCAAPGALRTGAMARGAEAMLLSAFAPTWEGGLPADAARAAGAGASALLTLDDRGGGIAPDVTLLVTGTAMLGNGLPWPAGPLSFAPQFLKPGDAVVAIGPQAALPGWMAQWRAPVLAARLSPLETGMDWQGMSVLAFAAGPERHAFFAALDTLGARVLRRVSIDGDKALPSALAQRLSRDAAMGRAQLVTTERDATRLPPVLRGQVLTLPMRLEFAQPEALEKVLAKAGISPGRSLP